MEQTIRTLTELEAPLEQFHDCHVHGLHWRRDEFTFSIALQFILEWIDPSDDSSGYYRFRVAEAELVFQDTSDPKVLMDWSNSAIDAQIEDVRVLESRATPAGTIERRFEIRFADPDGTISLWSTGYQVVLLAEPVVSNVPSIR